MIIKAKHSLDDSGCLLSISHDTKSRNLLGKMLSWKMKKVFFLSSPEDIPIDFRERRNEGEREGEKH